MKYFLLLFLFVSLFTSCEDDPYKDPENVELPPITMEGKNTFGCKINGEVWVPDVGKETLFNEKIAVSYESNQINIHARLNRPDLNRKENIYVTAPNILDTGTYTIPVFPADSFVYINSNLNIDCKTYRTKISNSKINITKLDVSKRIISGLFSFKDVNSCEDTLQITDGRFDLKY